MSLGSGRAKDDFLSETEEMLERITTSLALVEKRVHSAETLNSVYRDMHTIKGSAQLFGCAQMGHVAHAMESCLEPVRSGRVTLVPELVDAIYLGLDVIRSIARGLRRGDVEPDVGPELQLVVPRLAEIMAQLATGGTPLAKDLPGVADEVVPAPARLPVAPVVKAKDEKREERPVVTERAAPKEPVAEGAESIRVQVGLLDSLMNLVGELVLIRNQVIQYTSTAAEEAEFVNLSQRLNVVTTELQNEVMKTRMQPIGNILTKFQRIVRDTSRELGKEIELKLEGTETELDKTLIEAVKDPLTHIVRNSMDHGIEMPDVRRENGKDAKGQVLIRSYHEGGQVVVEVQDDGRGLNRKKIGCKAVERGLVAPDVLDKMTDREVNNLIFLPGFSTAEKVSNISGRGVGMDVVRTNIEKIGGMVDLTSVDGEGMTIRLKIPLTLAIVPALIVQARGERFAIPQVKLVELVRVDREETLQGQPVFRLRGSLLPLVSLGGLLGLGAQKTSDGAINVAVLNADGQQFGLIVDAIEDSTDIVVKPLGTYLKTLGVYSGATVLGDGNVALVLDVMGLATRAELFEEKSLAAAATAAKDDKAAATVDVTEYLVVDVGVPGRYAIPLELVNRLEELKRSAVERAGDRRVVRYRGSILPLISVSDQLALKDRDQRRTGEGENLSVVVVERAGRLYGLEVEAIIDVIALSGAVDPTVRDRPAILGTSVHADGVVVVIDPHRLIDDAAGPQIDAYEAGEAKRLASERGHFKILVAEDSEFTRRQIVQILGKAGFTLVAEPDGAAAFARLSASRPGEFSAVLSDIEMPHMTGLQLAEKVRADVRFKTIPMLALTTRQSDSDRERGLKAGFGRYLNKLNGEQLVAALDETIGIGKRKEPGYGT